MTGCRWPPYQELQLSKAVQVLEDAGIACDVTSEDMFGNCSPLTVDML